MIMNRMDNYRIILNPKKNHLIKFLNPCRHCVTVLIKKFSSFLDCKQVNIWYVIWENMHGSIFFSKESSGLFFQTDVILVVIPNNICWKKLLFSIMQYKTQGVNKKPY